MYPANFGFKPPLPSPKDHIFGSKESKLKGNPLTDGHWEKWLPIFEPQNRGFETNSCTSFGTTNVLETLAKFLGWTFNFSDRFSAITSGTNPEDGNDPIKVIETARKQGLIPEAELPFDSTIDTVEKFYSPKPMTQDHLTSGQNFLKQYTLGYDVVFADANSLKAALQYSPLGVSVYAWAQNADGLYYFPPGLPHNHWVCLYDYVEGKYWLVFDSYDNGPKKVAWDSVFQFVRRYSIQKKSDITPEQRNIFQKILDLIKQILQLDQQIIKTNPPIVIPDEAPPPPTPTDPQPKSYLFARAIEQYENFDKQYNNPGALKYLSYAKTHGATGSTPGGFARFPLYTVGFDCLQMFIKDAAENKLIGYHDCTIDSFFKTYSPTSDGNDPGRYAKFVSDYIGMATFAKLKDFI